MLPGNMGEYEEARLRIISEGAVPGMIKFLNEGHRENSLEEELMCLDSIYKLSQHQKNHMRMVHCCYTSELDPQCLRVLLPSACTRSLHSLHASAY